MIIETNFMSQMKNFHCQVYDVLCLNTFLLTDTLIIISLVNFSVHTVTVLIAIIESAGFIFTVALHFSKEIPLAENGRN